MKITAFIPLKENSQRLNKKNFRILGTKPLFMHLVEELLVSDVITEIYLFSNANFSGYNLPSKVKVLKRPVYLDEEKTMGIEIYREFVGLVKSDLYVLCHATSPYTKIDSIHEGINGIISHGHDSSFSVTKVQTFAWYKKEPLNFQLDLVPRTQDLEAIYLETSGFYIFSGDLILERNRRVGKNPFLVIVNSKESIDIDYEEDFQLAEFYLNCK